MDCLPRKHGIARKPYGCIKASVEPLAREVEKQHPHGFDAELSTSDPIVRFSGRGPWDSSSIPPIQSEKGSLGQQSRYIVIWARVFWSPAITPASAASWSFERSRITARLPYPSSTKEHRSEEGNSTRSILPNS